MVQNYHFLITMETITYYRFIVYDDSKLLIVFKLHNFGTSSPTFIISLLKTPSDIKTSFGCKYFSWIDRTYNYQNMSSIKYIHMDIKLKLNKYIILKLNFFETKLKIKKEKMFHTYKAIRIDCYSKVF